MMGENFLNFMKNINPQFKKFNITQIKIKRITPRYIIIRSLTTSNEETLIKTTRKGKKNYIGAEIRITTDVWSEIIQGRAQ